MVETLDSGVHLEMCCDVTSILKVLILGLWLARIMKDTIHITYTTKFLFHQSTTRHGHYMVTGKWQSSHCWQLPAARWLHCHWQLSQSLCCRQYSTVTTLSLPSNCVVTVSSRWLIRNFSCETAHHTCFRNKNFTFSLYVSL